MERSFCQNNLLRLRQTVHFSFSLFLVAVRWCLRAISCHKLFSVHFKLPACHWLLRCFYQALPMALFCCLIIKYTMKMFVWTLFCVQNHVSVSLTKSALLCFCFARW